MTNKRTTKQQLVASIVLLFMCFSMLLGTTFAWFTDSVTSTGNIIKTGTLDVEMYYADGTKAVPTIDGDWTTADGAAIYKANQLWEPGYTDAKHIKIENKGTLALKYQVAILPTGQVSDLAEVIDVYLYDGATQIADRDLDETKNVGTLADVIRTGIAKGNLDAKTDYTMTIVLKMQETAGNEYQDKSIGDDFTLQLLATQYTAENDSFGKDYDEDAPFGTYIELDAGADLLAAMASAQADMPLTIKLNGNVEWPTEGHHGENDITPASDITIIGNGNTITATGSGVTPLGDTEAPMTLKDVTIVDNSVSYNEGAWEFTYLEMGGTSLTCDNVTFADEIQLGTNATFTNCSFESNEESVYAVWVEDGSASFTGCTFTGYRGLKMHEDYGTEISSVVVDNCTFIDIAKKPGIAIGTLNADTTVSITGCTFINCQAGDQGKYIYETDTDVTTINFTEEDNTVLNNATIVSTKDELLALSAKALTANNNQPDEAIIIINADIDMQGASFSAIIAQRGDKLTILGNGHKISNVKVVSGENDNTTGQASMFYAYPNSTLSVSNLTLENITVTAEANGSGYAAAVVGYCEGTAVLDNVDVVGATVTGVKSSGMLVGHLSGSLTATDCDITGTVTLADFAEEANGHYAGKYIGTLAGAANMTKCTANVTVSGNLNAANIGDIYGRKTPAGSSNVEYAKDSAALNAAINSGAEIITLGGDIQYQTPIKNDANIDLAGNTFEAIGTIELGNNADLTMKGGSYEVNGTYGHIDARPSSAEGSDLVFEDVDFSFNKKGPTYGPSTNRLGTVLEVCATAADAKTVVVFKNCTFDNAQILFEGMSGTVGEFEATFENCTFNALTSSAPIYVQNYVKGTINVIGCTFNLECTSSTASAISVSFSSSTTVTVKADGNTINAVAATPYTYDAAAGETEVYNVKVNGTPANINFISAGENTIVTETNTTKTGIAQ